MSLNKLIRSASRLVPLAVRASAGSRWYSLRHHSSAFSATVNGRLKELQSPRSFPSILLRYSTEISSDESLLKSVEYEIECANDSYSVTEVYILLSIPSLFRFRFSCLFLQKWLNWLQIRPRLQFRIRFEIHS